MKAVGKIFKTVAPVAGILAAPFTAGLSLPAMIAVDAGIGAVGAGLSGGNILKGALGGAAGGALGGIGGGAIGSSLGLAADGATQAAISGGLQGFGNSLVTTGKLGSALGAGALGGVTGAAANGLSSAFGPSSDPDAGLQAKLDAAGPDGGGTASVLGKLTGDYSAPTTEQAQPTMWDQAKSMFGGTDPEAAATNASISGGQDMGGVLSRLSTGDTSGGTQVAGPSAGGMDSVLSHLTGSSAGASAAGATPAATTNSNSSWYDTPEPGTSSDSSSIWGKLKSAVADHPDKAVSALATIAGGIQGQQNVTPQQVKDAVAGNQSLPTYQTTTTNTPYGGDYYTYGSRPEFQFINRETTAVPNAQKLATGGQVQGSSAFDAASPNPAIFAQDGQVAGQGKGQDDQVPAMLSADEYVIPADVVAALGDGSSTAGGSVFDQMVSNVRQQKGTSGQPPKAKASAFDYLPAKKTKKGRA